MKEEKGSSLKTWLSRFSIFTGLLLIAFGVFRYIKLDVTFDEPWTIFQPAYVIIFGLILLLSEFGVEIITNNLKFLSNYFGRGVFIIYLSTIVTGNLTGGDVFKYISIIVAIILLITGLLYLFIHCFCAPSEVDDKKAPLDPEKQNTSSSKVIYIF